MKCGDVFTFSYHVLLIFATCNVNVSGSDVEKEGEKQPLFESDQTGHPLLKTDFPVFEITEPSKELLIEMGSNIPIVLNYTIACQSTNSVYTLSVRSSNTFVFVLKGNSTFEVTCEEAVEVDFNLSSQNVSENEGHYSYTTNHSSLILATRGSVRMSINGILLGIESMHVQLKNGGPTSSLNVTESVNDSVISERRFTVGVLRPVTLVDIVFRIVIGVAVSLVLLGFGCGLNLEVVKECLKKPIAPGIGLGCQYILMPLVIL